jgi:hypothetical protein
MTSSTDFQKLWFLYKTEGAPNGISINDFCLSRGVTYSEFEKWYKKNMQSIAEVQVRKYRYKINLKKMRYHIYYFFAKKLNIIKNNTTFVYNIRYIFNRL